GRFEPGIREEGLLAVGGGRISVSESGIAGYDGLARSIAAQVTSEEYRELLIPCKPKTPTSADDVCAKEFISTVGRRLYRRPLTKDEVNLAVNSARSASAALHDFYKSLSLVLANMLESPELLFRRESAE